ncbi:amino acid transporter [Sarocladium strictum]
MPTTEPPVQGQLQRRLSGLTMVAMAFAIFNTWIALASSVGLVLPSGGSVSFLYGFVFCVFCELAVAASLGEMASIWPTAGGQYHFVYALCSDRWKRVMSFYVGWLNIGGWLVAVTVQAFFGAQIICAAAVIASNGTYAVTQWSTYLIFLAILTFGTAGNIWGNRILGRYNDAALAWSILGAVIIAIILLAMSDKTDASFVFTDFNNETGWPDGVAWILGLLQSVLSLVGIDVVLHMSEEMPNPSRDAPRAMMVTIAVGAVTGVGFILTMLFCLTDLDAILASPTGMPIVEMLLRATKNRAATTFLTLMLSICFINGTVGSLASVSRLIWSMSRDRGIVFHTYFSHIDPKLSVPVRAILLAFAFNVCFGLLYLGPSVAFSAYVASCTILLNVSYVFPVFTLLVRGRQVLEQHRSLSTPFQLGRWGYFINWVSVIFVSVTSVFFCFPAFLPVTSNTMNYVSVVLSIFVVLITTYWVFLGSTFEGPTFDTILTGEATDGHKASLVYESNVEKGKTDKVVLV